MVYIILVNWNGWRDTIECLESVLRLKYDQFRVLVCDNASSDDSLDRIAEWARGDAAAGCANAQLKHLTFPPLPKPIPLLRFGPGEQVDLRERTERLILIQTGANLGFAGGNNVGLRLALAAGDLEYAWLLNNDTVVEPDALLHMVEKMRQRPDAGVCGSTLLYYSEPERVQALGGSVYNRWTARGGHIGLNLHRDRLPSEDWVEQRMKYVVGASMLVSSEFLERVGLLDERYFLYFEEIDWATRAKGFFKLLYCPESIVYHKEGASIGTSDLKGKARSGLCERFASQNRMLFTRTHIPRALATVLLAVLVSALQRLLTGEINLFIQLVKGAWAGLHVQKAERPGSAGSRAKSMRG